MFLPYIARLLQYRCSYHIGQTATVLVFLPYRLGSSNIGVLTIYSQAPTILVFLPYRLGSSNIGVLTIQARLLQYWCSYHIGQAPPILVFLPYILGSYNIGVLTIYGQRSKCFYLHLPELLVFFIPNMHCSIFKSSKYIFNYVH